jgi:mevalonate pyrophosphate decarboxylase
MLWLALDGANEIWMYIWITRKNALDLMHCISLQHNVYASMTCTDASLTRQPPSHGVLQAPHSRPRPAATQQTMHATHSQAEAECTTDIRHANAMHFSAGMVDCHAAAAAVAAATALLSSDRKQGTCTTACCTACRATQVCSMQVPVPICNCCHTSVIPTPNS